MFVPQALFDKLTGAYERFLADLRNHTEMALDRILAAKDAEVRSVIAAKDLQLNFYRSEMDVLRTQIEHERARAEKAIDQLLVKQDAAPVGYADLERDIARNDLDKEQPTPKTTDRSRAAAKIFSEVNSVLEDLDEGMPTDTLAAIGGHPVSAGK